MAVPRGGDPMSERAKSVLDAALALAAEERREVLDGLIGSLTPDEALEAELDRRLAEYRRDPSVAQTWDELRQAGRAP